MTFALRLPHKRPGFNHGAWSTVTDWVNTDSMIQDADHERDLFVRVVDAPRPGDLVVWPSILAGEVDHNARHPGQRERIGHVGIVVDVS